MHFLIFTYNSYRLSLNDTRSIEAWTFEGLYRFFNIDKLGFGELPKPSGREYSHEVKVLLKEIKENHVTKTRD